MTSPPLADLWFFLMGFILLVYVILDGFDLGIGILSLGSRDEEYCSVLMGTMGPVWHANLTWLVVLGGMLFGAFPLAYGVVLSALYLPIIFMLLGFIFRGVALEFRQEARHQGLFSLAFGVGSLTATLAQGFALGGLLSGIKVAGDTFAGGVWDWLNPFAALVAVVFACGYLLLGATYLIRKTAGAIQRQSYPTALVAAFLTLVAVTGLGCWALIRHPFLAQKWFTWPYFLWTTLPVLLGLGAFIMLIRSLLRPRELAPFLWSAAFISFLSISLAASLYPVIIPPGVTIAMAAAPPLILKVMLIVIGPLLPVMLLYNAYQYRVFRGKVTKGGYGD